MAKFDKIIETIRTDPSNSSCIYELESAIKSNWKAYYLESYDKMTFDSVFSEILYQIQVSKIKDYKDLRRKLYNLYNSKYKEIKASLSSKPNVELSSFKDLAIDLSKLQNSEKIVFLDYLINHGKKSSAMLSGFISRLRFRSKETNDNTAKFEELNKFNLPALYLIDKLGFLGYKNFVDLMQNLGIYYPFDKLPDDELIMEVKTKLVNKFIESVDLENVSIDEISKIMYGFE